jgi:hypothetical protein
MSESINKNTKALDTLSKTKDWLISNPYLMVSIVTVFLAIVLGVFGLFIGFCAGVGVYMHNNEISKKEEKEYRRKMAEEEILHRRSLELQGIKKQEVVQNSSNTAQNSQQNSSSNVGQTAASAVGIAGAAFVANEAYKEANTEGVSMTFSDGTEEVTVTVENEGESLVEEAGGFIEGIFS